MSIKTPNTAQSINVTPRGWQFKPGMLVNVATVAVSLQQTQRAGHNRLKVGKTATADFLWYTLLGFRALRGARPRAPARRLGGAMGSGSPDEDGFGLGCGCG